LVARQPKALDDFPASITVGVDGSGESLRALAAARELGERLAVPVRTIAASGGKPVDFDGLRGVEELDWDERKPVAALVDASRGTHLLVIGSRGLHGLSALGSVSERVAHKAASSVLVVRVQERGP
jgi:nucleotide-binding universal stress UspA family protein